MDYKHKHLHQLKKTLLVSALALTTLSCTDNKKEENSCGDMLSLNEVTEKDVAGNSVVLKKITIPTCDKDKNPSEIQLVAWGLDNQPKVARNEKTYATAMDMGDGIMYVETYKDGVLKHFPSMAVVEGQLRVVGDEKNYAKNLAYIRNKTASREKAKNDRILSQRRQDRRDEPVQTVEDDIFRTEETDSLASVNDTVSLHGEQTLKVGEHRVAGDSLKNDSLASMVIEMSINKNVKD